MAEPYQYRANVKDKVKRLETNTGPSLPSTSSTNSTKSKPKMIPTVVSSSVTPVKPPVPETSAAIMDVEITQLNSSQLTEASTLPKLSVNGNSNFNSDSDTEPEPPISVKNLLRRFSSGMTHTFRKKTGDGETSGVQSSKTLAISATSGSRNVVDLEDSAEVETHANNSFKNEGRMFRSKSVSYEKNQSLMNGAENSIPSKSVENSDTSKSKIFVPTVKSTTSTNVTSIQAEPKTPSQTAPKISTNGAEGGQNSFGLSKLKLLHFPRKSKPENQSQVVEEQEPQPTPRNKIYVISQNAEDPPTHHKNDADTTIPTSNAELPLQSVKTNGHDEEINNNFQESPKPKPRVVKPALVLEKNHAPPKQIVEELQNSIIPPTDTVLVVGPHRAGKSSVVNYLLHQDLSTVYKSSPPSKREIVECMAKTRTGPHPNDVSSLILIDTPGFINDKLDAAMWSALTSHLDSTTPLDVKSPNFIIVVVGVDESGNLVGTEEFPNFFKLLFHYWQNSFSSFPKFLFAISHSYPLDILKGRDAIRQLSGMTKQYFPIRVCFHRLIHKDDVNPHKSLASTYPDLLAGLRSFFDDKDTATQSDPDNQKFASTIVKHIFGPTYPKPLTECFLSKRIPLQSVEHPETLKTHKLLQNLYQNVVIEPTEIATLLEIGWENVNSTLRKKYPSSLLTLQQVMQKCAIKEFANLPEDPRQVFELLKYIPQHNPAITDLLTETLQLKIPSCYSALYIGQGYDLSKDIATHVSPFQFSGILKTSPVGLIPDEISCKLTEDREIIFKFYSTFEEYALDRFKDLGIKHATFPVKSGNLSPNAFQNNRIGYNIVKQPVPEPNKTTTATANVEYRTFQLSLTRGGENGGEEIEFKSQFWDTLSSLPELDIKNLETIDCWSEFFKYWGTHVVKAAHGGGSILVSFRGKILSKIYKSLGSKSEVLADELETSRVFQWLTGDGLDFARPQNAKAEFMQEIDVNTSFNGGDMRFQQIDLTKLPHERVAGSTREEWIQSLALNPVILETNMVLVPLSYFVREKSEGFATKMDVAFLHFYANFMALQGKQSACSIL